MNLQQSQSADGFDAVRVVNHLSHLESITHHDLEAIIWKRIIPSSVIEYLNEIQINNLKTHRLYVPVADITENIVSVFEAMGLKRCLARDWLVNDIVTMASQLSQILSAPKLQVRIGCVNDNACRRFHRDNVAARLICTYRGPGTQYGLAALNQTPEQIETVQTGHPIVLKGKLWSKAQDPVLLHRSPPIEGTGLTRLLLVIDDVANSYPV